MALVDDAAIDLERFELRLFPNDPPPSADLLAETNRLPYDFSGSPPSPALVRVVERFGLPERPLVATREEGDDDEYQVLSGAAWIQAAREAGMDRVPVRVLELPDLQAAFLALVLNQPAAADVALQSDALQALLEAGVDEQDLARASGLGRGRIRRLASLLELHPALRQGLREGRLRPQVALGAARLSPASQDELAGLFEREGEVTSADLRRLGQETAGQDAAVAEPNGEHPTEPHDDPAIRARRQAEELLRTLEQASMADEIRQQVAEVVEQLGRIAV
jgi:ParB-like chromosome segregation protein Spo0J